MWTINPCPYCGILMANPRRVQCGALDCKRRYQRDRIRSYFADYRQQTGTHYQYRHKPHEKCCETCGELFETREPQIRFCSRSCANKILNATRRWDRTCEECMQPFQAKAPVARRCPDCKDRGPGTDLVLWRRPPQWVLLAEAGRIRAHPLRKRWYAGQCKWCGDWFIHDQPHTSTCTQRCAKRFNSTQNHLRRRLHGREPGKVQRWRVFERDEWMCKLCGEPVEREKSVPHPLAPTIDHIIPLAAWPEFDGAVHEDSNLQCAHFSCNREKGASVAA